MLGRSSDMKNDNATKNVLNLNSALTFFKYFMQFQFILWSFGSHMMFIAVFSFDSRLYLLMFLHKFHISEIILKNLIHIPEILFNIIKTTD